MKRSASIALVVVSGLTPVLAGMTGPAAAAADLQDPITADASVTLTASQVGAALHAATAPTSPKESASVTAYSADQQLPAAQLRVGTISVTPELKATIVVPASGIAVDSVSLWANAETEDTGAAVQLRDTSEPTTGGPILELRNPSRAASALPTRPGPVPAPRTYWPSWADVPSYTVRLDVWWDPVFGSPSKLGVAEFETKRRKYVDGGVTTSDKWQVSRGGWAQPVDHVTVKKLWMSSKLTDYPATRVQKWLGDETAPKTQSEVCSSSGGAVTVGAYSYSPSDCSSYSPWMGAPGHYRFAMDQGVVSRGGMRDLAYKAAVQMDEYVSPSMTWYEFVTFRIGNVPGIVNPDYKCTSDALGSANDTQVVKCMIDEDLAGGNGREEAEPPPPPAPTPPCSQNDAWRAQFGASSYQHIPNSQPAQPNQQRYIFDRIFYYSTYPDVRAWAQNKVATQGGNLYDHVQWHWLNYGIPQGRMGAATFDPAFYMRTHGDVAAAYGATNYEGAIQHYVAFGRNEGRIASPVFDPTFYRACYGDLAGKTNAELLYHFTTYGLEEGRQASASFAPAWYLAAYPDVRAAFGSNNYRGGMIHWLSSGRGEGRAGHP